MLLITLWGRDTAAMNIPFQFQHLLVIVAWRRVYHFSHSAGVDREGTFDELELQYTSLQGGGRGLHHLHILLLFLSLLLLSARDHPQVVAFSSPALETVEYKLRSEL